MKSLTFFLQLAILAVSRAKPSHCNYPQPEGLAPQHSLTYTPQEQHGYLLPPPPQYATVDNSFQQQQQQTYAPVQETYKKEFFIFSAPEEDFEDSHAAQKISSTLQKNVRVVFIRTPEQKGLEQAALQIAKQVSDDKTAIYVLSKQADVGDLANRLSAHREQYTHKPEVHFVKYRTPEDAAHAQQHIQSQYDLLRGSSHTSNEGAAPVLDFSTKQKPIYGSAISVVPAYAGVNNAGSNLNGYPYYGQQVASNVGLAGGIDGYDKVVGLGGVNSFSSLKTVGYNTNSITSSNSGSYGAVGAVGGFDTIGYGANEADNAPISTTFNGYGDPRGANIQQLLAEKRVSKTNERVNTAGKLIFPTESASENTYLPPIKKS